MVEDFESFELVNFIWYFHINIYPYDKSVYNSNICNIFILEKILSKLISHLQLSNWHIVFKNWKII